MSVSYPFLSTHFSKRLKEEKVRVLNKGGIGEQREGREVERVKTNKGTEEFLVEMGGRK